MRPEKLSDVVRITCATSGPSGSQTVSGSVAPFGVVTDGVGCSVGAGKPRSIQRSSSSVPLSDVVWAGSTGKNRAPITARRSDSCASSTAISSPSR